MSDWQVTQVSEFLKERVGRYKPSDPIISKLKRLDKIDFSGGMHFSDKSSKTDMIIAKKGDLVISGINVAKGALAVYDGDEAMDSASVNSRTLFQSVSAAAKSARLLLPPAGSYVVEGDEPLSGPTTLPPPATTV